MGVGRQTKVLGGYQRFLLGRRPQEVDSGEGVKIVIEDVPFSVVLAMDLSFGWEVQCKRVVE